MKFSSIFVISFLFYTSAIKGSATHEADKDDTSNKAVIKYTRKENVAVDTVGGIVDGLAAAKYNSGLKYGLGSKRFLSKSTQVAVVDSAGQWVFRLDIPHGKMKYHHVNINPKLTGVRDPHMKIPGGVVTAGSAVGSTIETVSKNLGYIQLAVDGYRLVTAVHEDLNSDASSGRTKKTVASIAGASAGGYTGAYVGSTVGGYVGGAIGFVFGGVGSVPGAALGSMIGGLFGSVTGSSIGQSIAEEMAS